MRFVVRRLLGLTLVAASAHVHAQVFGPSGPEFRVDTTTAGAQYAAALAVDRAFGGFLVTWVGPGADGHLVFARRFAQNGGAIDASDFQVNANTTGDHLRPRAAAGELGTFVVVWERDNTTPAQDVFGQRFDSAGEVGGVFGINTTAHSQFPEVASDSALDFVAVWNELGNVNAQRYDATGAPQGGEFQVNEGTVSGDYPSVARTPGGSFVVAWERGTDIFARRFSAAGAPLATEFQVSVLTGGTHERPRVAASAAGFVVTWYHTPSGGDANVKARLFDAAGAPVTGEFRVNTYTTGSQFFPDAGMDGSGNFVIVWNDDHQSAQDGFDDGIFAQRYASDGNPIGAQFRVNTTTTDIQRKAAVAMQTNGDFVVAWTDYHTTSGDIRAQRYCHALAGDANGSGAIDVSDVFYLINSLFASGPPPTSSADANGDGSTNVSDVFYLINFLFASGPPPACPAPII